MNSALLLAALVLPAQDPEAALKEAERHYTEAKAACEGARTAATPAAFASAEAKVETARARYAALKETGPEALRKQAAVRLQELEQLGLQIREGKSAASSGTPVPAASPADAPATLPAKVMQPRVPVPDPAVLKDAEKAVRDHFKAEYEKKTLPGRLGLVQALLALAAKSGDEPSVQWVLLREAQEVAFQIFDVPLAFRAADEASRIFLVEGRALKSEGVAAVSKLAKGDAELTALAKAQLLLADEGAASDDFEFAEKAAAGALQFAKRTKDQFLVLKVQVRSKEIGEGRKRLDAVLKTRDLLVKNPEDPPANLVWGVYLCFTKGDWDKGLPHLAKCPDPKLKAAAAKDLMLPEEAERRMEAGDGWWALAQEEKPGARRDRLLERTRHWYEQACAGLTGLTKLKVEKRLAEIDQAMPGPVNLLRLIDPQKDGLSGIWTMSGRGLASPSAVPSWARLQIPYVPPAEYDLDLVVHPRTPEYGLRLILPLEGRQSMLVLAGGGGHRGGLEMIDNRSWSDNNPTLCTLEAPGERVRISCVVRKGSLKVLVEGRQVIEWKEFRRVSLYSGWALPQTESLGLAVGPGSFEVERALLTPIGPPGKRLR